MKERDLRIDLVKLIATAMVVILHTVENAGGGTRRNVCICSARLVFPFFLQ